MGTRSRLSGTAFIFANSNSESGLLEHRCTYICNLFRALEVAFTDSQSWKLPQNTIFQEEATFHYKS